MSNGEICHNQNQITAVIKWAKVQINDTKTGHMTQKRDKQGRLLAKGLEPCAHKFRFKKGQLERINRLKLGDINLMDFVRESVDRYLCYIEKTGDTPDLPKYQRKPKKIQFQIGETVLVENELGEVIALAKAGWYRIKMTNSEEIKLVQNKYISIPKMK